METVSGWEWGESSVGEDYRSKARYNRQDRLSLSLGVSDLIDTDTRAQGSRMTLRGKRLDARD